MTLDGGQDGSLLFARERAQGVCQAGPDGALGELLLRVFGKPGSDVDPLRHPFGFSPELACDGLLGELVLGEHGADSPRLVEGRECPSGRIGHKE